MKKQNENDTKYSKHNAEMMGYLLLYIFTFIAHVMVSAIMLDIDSRITRSRKRKKYICIIKLVTLVSVLAAVGWLMESIMHNGAQF